VNFLTKGKKTMKRLKCKRGQGLTEYLILLMLIAVVSIGAARTLGGTIKSKIDSANTRIRGDISAYK
jgi:Flp pilus assembly pilin Flp